MNVLDRIHKIADELDGKVCLAAQDLKTGEKLVYNDKHKCPTASVIKLPILVHTMLLVHEGSLSLDETVISRAADKVPGSGILTHLSDDFALSLRDACRLMITLSDNTATNLVLDCVTVDGVNERMQNLGLRDIWLSRPVYCPSSAPSPAEKRYGLGCASPRDMLRLLEMIHTGKIGNADVSAQIRAMLSVQFYRDGIPRLLPENYTYEGKTGSVNAVRNDVGLVTTDTGRTIAMSIFCSRMKKIMWTADNPGLVTISRLSKVIVDHFTGE